MSEQSLENLKEQLSLEEAAVTEKAIREAETKHLHSTEIVDRFSLALIYVRSRDHVERGIELLKALVPDLREEAHEMRREVFYYQAFGYLKLERYREAKACCISVIEEERVSIEEREGEVEDEEACVSNQARVLQMLIDERFKAYWIDVAKGWTLAGAGAAALVGLGAGLYYWLRKRNEE